jgi:hypothetical protein
MPWSLNAIRASICESVIFENLQPAASLAAGFLSVPAVRQVVAATLSAT